MSFGFAVGDFLAAITFIHEVASALDSASGSASEVKLIFTALTNIEKSILTTKEFFETFPTTIGHQSQVDIAKSIHKSIQEQLRQCIIVVESFYRTFKAHSTALVEGRGSRLSRSFRKITWLRKKDDVTTFVTSLDVHLKALNNYNALLLLYVAIKGFLSILIRSADFSHNTVNMLDNKYWLGIKPCNRM